MSTIRNSFSSAARDASDIANKKDLQRQLADLEPFLDHSVHQLDGMKTEHSEEIATIVEKKASQEGTLSRMSQFFLTTTLTGSC